MRVLYVEDDAINRKVMRAFLEAGGIALGEAVDGLDGLAHLEGGSYDIVLMDIRMPRMDGLEAIRRIRAWGGDKAQVPIAAVTADVSTALTEECKAAGANAVVHKPIDASSLFATIGELLARSATPVLV